MGSTKSLILLTTAHQFDEKDIPCLVMKPSIDDRDGSNVIASRIGIQKECLSIKPEINLYELVKQCIEIQNAKFQKKLSWILIDEAQFLTEEQVDQLSFVVDSFDVNVMCFGLRTDFKSKMFLGSKRLMEIADTIEEIKSSCSCGNKTMINARIDNNGMILSSGEQVMIGGNDTYIPLCRKCWRDRLNKKKI